MKEESWRPVLGYEGFYEVSDFGHVRALPRITTHVNRWGTINTQHRLGRNIITATSRNGYIRVQLNRLGDAKSFLVHRLVAAAFIREMESVEQVNHIDGVHANNALSNLEICTPKENSQHSVRTGLYPFGDRNGSRTSPRPRGEANTASKLTLQDVSRIRAMRASGMTLKAIAANFPVNFQSISNVVRGNTWVG